ncbi:MAG TPA: T9SS type A sorting domain-containing protein, partial [Sediminibacterium sp.]|nr:T9SS type A sorting domain-containing protein [Sediminibacterium sp.]
APENYVKILQINPNPVVTRMVATVYSRNSNIDAEILIYDIYGQVKLSLKKNLLQGNNMLEIATDQLYHGPYFLVVRTNNGKDSKAFYKL